MDKDMINTLKDMGADIFVELIQLYLEEAPNQIAEIKQQFASGNAKAMGEAAHSLKGSSLNLGANHLADICKQIELKGKRGDLSALEGLLDQLDQQYQEVQKELEHEIASIVI